MPLQNRVTPWSEIVAHPARYEAPAAMFGNRGCLHDEQVWYAGSWRETRDCVCALSRARSGAVLPAAQRARARRGA